MAWTTQEHTLSLAGGTSDFLVSGNSMGKVLFVTGTNGSYAPYSVEFTDMAGASSDWWWNYPATAARPEDYNFGLNTNSMRIAFYRKNGSLYVRVPYGYASADTLNIVTATGNWTEGIDTNAVGVLSEYHALPEIRAAMNLCDACEWTGDAVRDDVKAKSRMINLSMQENRILEQFKLAKKSLTADDVIYRENDDYYF